METTTNKKQSGGRPAKPYQGHKTRKTSKPTGKQEGSSKGKRPQVGLNYTNKEKINKNFMYKDLKRSNCYDCDFSASNFDFTSFRGAHFKSCNFYEASFKAAEFVGSNLKKSRFKRARFEDVVFEGANLDGVDFSDAYFKNTIFVGCNVKEAKNLNTISVNIKVYEEMPPLEISEALKEAVEEAFTNKMIKASRVLDTKEGTINPISIMRMLRYFDEETLIKGLKRLTKEANKDFCTLSYIIKMISDYEAENLAQE